MKSMTCHPQAAYQGDALRAGVRCEMSIEIDVLNGNTSWPAAEPLFNIVWSPEIMATVPWRDIKWAHADLRVLIETPADGLVCHVGIYFRTVTWNGRKLDIGGIGGVITHPDCRGQGYASVALRDHEAVEFALLFCEPHNFAFYQSRGWHPFEGEVYAEQPEGRVRFEAMAPFIFHIKRSPRQGVIDLCGLPW
jgi:predicted acetyltransferase